MKRSLSTVVAVAAVVGTIGGTVAAVTLAHGSPTSRDAAAGPDASPVSGVGQVLWADRVGLHDGDLTVDLALVDRPVSVQRIPGGGWIVSETTDDLPTALGTDDRRGRQTSLVRPDGTVTVLGPTYDFGDVSPDGKHFIGARSIGGEYGIWDLATGELESTISGGRAAGQTAAGGAQYVDDDTVATTWLARRYPDPAEVLLSEVGSTEQRLLADDVLGDWAISPDGRWFVGSLAVGTGDQATEGCTVVRSLDGEVDDSVDCEGSVDGVPSFTPDSTAVLTVLRSHVFRTLPLVAGQVAQSFDRAGGAREASLIGADRIAIVSSPDDGATGSAVLVCDSGTGCSPAGHSESPREAIALGS